MKPYLTVLLFLLLRFIGYGQSIVENNCISYVESLKSKDTLLIVSTVSRERLKHIETILIYKNDGKFFATLSLNKRDTVIQLNNIQIEMIKTFERDVLNQSLAGREALLAGSSAKYDLVFREGKVSYSSRTSFYSLYAELLDKLQSG